MTVVDGTDPTMTCPADVTQSTDFGACTAFVTIPNPAVDDNCGPTTIVNDYNNTSSATDTYPVGTTTVTFTVTDGVGNQATCSIMVTITEDEAPIVTCPPAPLIW